MRLFEFDPRIARAAQQAASGIGQAGQTLAQPLVLRDIDGAMMQGIDKLEKEIQKEILYRLNRMQSENEIMRPDTRSVLLWDIEELVEQL